MINILDKKDCCGCASCVQVCPKQCISMNEDCEGFLYPKVDSAVCVDCGLCEKVCPIINQGYTIVPLATYAAKNKDEKIRYKSSSGGVFTLIAEQILADGGVVFGARFNENWEVIHDYAETVEGLEPFRGSKYVQSVIGDNYKYAKQFLLEGRNVLFSGTPCQIAGLKKFLRKEYENLLTVEVVCHGVPSPKVWRDYLQYKRAQHVVGKNTVSSSIDELPVITGISFRDKTKGWKKFGFKICYAALKAAENSVSKSANIDNCEITPFNEDLFMKGFLKNLYLRPSCYQCMARQGKSGADIAIADYWGIQRIHPELDDDKGVNLVLINTQKGEVYFNEIEGILTYTISDYRKAIANNPCIVKSVAEPSQRVLFWKEYESHGVTCIDGICQSMTPSKFKVLFGRIVRKLKSFVR
ncbi:MAG: Coenzyme F420 hydrogenase/dehydrogenase, beta subunit C-terminal domain [Paludibacteraceae bacterium]|nr:Coenzyme F420 hydrogenase/dehydrogenase, beta subunit C-terminal domain [Paludibacteraceae bacterium]